MSNAIFIDTWGWLTLNDAGESRHTEVANLYRTLITDRILIYTSTLLLQKMQRYSQTRIQQLYLIQNIGSKLLYPVC
jgi:hypothetical protein